MVTFFTSSTFEATGTVFATAGLAGTGTTVVFAGGFFAIFAGAAFDSVALAATTLTISGFDAGFVAAFAVDGFAGEDFAIGFLAAALLTGFLAVVLLAAALAGFDFIRDDTLASLAREAKARLLEAVRVLAEPFAVDLAAVVLPVVFLASLLERVVLFDTALAWNRHAPVHGFFRGTLDSCRQAGQKQVPAS